MQQAREPGSCLLIASLQHLIWVKGNPWSCPWQSKGVGQGDHVPHPCLIPRRTGVDSTEGGAAWQEDVEHGMGAGCT